MDFIYEAFSIQSAQERQLKAKKIGKDTTLGLKASISLLSSSQLVQFFLVIVFTKNYGTINTNIFPPFGQLMTNVDCFFPPSGKQPLSEKNKRVKQKISPLPGSSVTVLENLEQLSHTL